ncbi:MAG: hypothetical protein OEY64_09830 [Nitrospinota bacterium]|nr:hypothetical protein [Nitrospinota bacterium]
MKKPISHFFIFSALAVAFAAGSASAEKLSTSDQLIDSLPTNVLGTSLTEPPSLTVIRSERGGVYFANKFKANNLVTHSRLSKLKRHLRKINYDKKMVIVVLSKPTDNYDINLKNVSLDEGIINVDVEYKHEVKDYAIPPKKAVYYNLVAVKKLSEPVLLKAKEIQTKGDVEDRTKVTVTGRLMRYTDDILQVIPVRIRRGQKNSYYIKGEIVAELEAYIGKVITLEGTISHAKDGPYEAELSVTKFVSVK